MKVSIEVSLYPLKDDYIPAIRAFIATMQGYADIKVKPNDMSTQLFGDYDVVMDAMKREIRASYEHYGRGVFVCKIIEGDLSD